jgi:glc operon protein GlcG
MRILLASLLAIGATLLTTESAVAQLTEKKVLTLEAARRMVAADPAYTASVELAPEKARAAALFKKLTAALEHAIDQGRIAAVTARGFIEMQGGLPIVVDGLVIGGIGASFDTPAHDVEIAQAGLAALKR